MDQSTASEMLRQIIEGVDITAPKSLLRNITKEKAALRMPAFPYSILENLWHADVWQIIWVDKLEGRRQEGIWEKNWRTPHPDEWPDVRASFLANIEKAHAIASAKPFRHKMKSKDAAVKTLVQLAIHDSYHIGQITLIKRVLRKSKT
ncbi:MAG: DinB family protein [Armatimonadetes bacterium]|nr:DinB family protein [Armatimonadota bacterium]